MQKLHALAFGRAMDFIKLYDSHYRQVRKFILTITKDDWVADDLLQETFIRVKKNMKSVHKTDKISSWIFKIAYHLCMDHLKKKHKETRYPVENGKNDFDILPFKKLEQQQMNDCIREKMERLAEPMRIIIDLYDIMEFTHKEIAGILSITEQNSKVKLHRARKELKSILSQECSLKHDERNVLICEPVFQKRQIKTTRSETRPESRPIQ